MYAMMGLSFLPLALFLVILCLTVPGFKVRYGLVATLIGLFSLVPIVVVQYLVLQVPVLTNNTLVEALLTVMVFNGLIEETVKMFAMVLLPHRKPGFPAFLAMAFVCGLALGCFETIIYLFSGYHNIETRTLTAVLMHSFCAGLSGVYVWTWRHPVEGADGKMAPMVTPFVLATVLHGVYNFFAGLDGWLYWFSVVAIVMAALECRIWYRRASGADTEDG